MIGDWLAERLCLDQVLHVISVIAWMAGSVLSADALYVHHTEQTECRDRDGCGVSDDGAEASEADHESVDDLQSWLFGLLLVADARASSTGRRSGPIPRAPRSWR